MRCSRTTVYWMNRIELKSKKNLEERKVRKDLVNRKAEYFWLRERQESSRGTES